MAGYRAEFGRIAASLGGADTFSDWKASMEMWGMSECLYWFNWFIGALFFALVLFTFIGGKK